MPKFHVGPLCGCFQTHAYAISVFVIMRRQFVCLSPFSLFLVLFTGSGPGLLGAFVHKRTDAPTIIIVMSFVAIRGPLSKRCDYDYSVFQVQTGILTNLLLVFSILARVPQNNKLSLDYNLQFWLRQSCWQRFWNLEVLVVPSFFNCHTFFINS